LRRTSYYGCTGQRCLSGAILAPVGDMADQLIEKFTFAAKAVRMGDGLDEKTTMGPVVSVVRCKDINEVVELINTRGFANAACIYTSSGAAAREFKNRVKPSMVGVNIGIAAPMSFFPFGDTKGHGQEIFNFFTDTKVVIERWL
jgi:acyl-CoA reductase-like NAD-dependent aldehyde dehydrogenase